MILPDSYVVPNAGEFDAVGCPPRVDRGTEPYYCLVRMSSFGYACTLRRGHDGYVHVAHTRTNTGHCGRVVAVEYAFPAHIRLPPGL